MSTVVLYCWCHSDGASVLFYIGSILILLARKYGVSYGDYKVVGEHFGQGTNPRVKYLQRPQLGKPCIAM